MGFMSLGHVARIGPHLALEHRSGVRSTQREALRAGRIARRIRPCALEPTSAGAQRGEPRRGLGHQRRGGRARSISGCLVGRSSAARNRSMTSGCVISAMIFIGPWHTGHSGTSRANTRRISSAQVIRRRGRRSVHVQSRGPSTMTGFIGSATAPTRGAIGGLSSTARDAEQTGDARDPPSRLRGRHRVVEHGTTHGDERWREHRPAARGRSCREPRACSPVGHHSRTQPRPRRQRSVIPQHVGLWRRNEGDELLDELGRCEHDPTRPVRAAAPGYAHTRSRLCSAGTPRRMGKP